MLNIAGLQSSTKVKFPGAAEDEYINIRDVKGWQTDLNIQVSCYEPDAQNPDINRLNGDKYNRAIANHMIINGKNEDGAAYPGWVIHQPPKKDGTSSPDLPFDKDMYLGTIIELLGRWLNQQFNSRDYSIAPFIKEGTVDADGEKLTFQETGALRTEEPVAGDAVAGS